jgi:hypothetical protein
LVANLQSWNPATEPTLMASKSNHVRSVMALPGLSLFAAAVVGVPLGIGMGIYTTGALASSDLPAAQHLHRSDTAQGNNPGSADSLNGYRWAAENLGGGSHGNCPNVDWNFRRGCLRFLQERGS